MVSIDEINTGKDSDFYGNITAFFNSVWSYVNLCG
jgi:hypothetical protein